jgi:hypothetical protein
MYNSDMKNTTTEQTNLAEYLVMQILIEAHRAGLDGIYQNEIFEILGLECEDENPFMSLSADVIDNIDLIEAQFEAKISSLH